MRTFTDAQVRELIRQLHAHRFGPSFFKSEAAFCPACRVRAGRMTLGIEVANALAKVMGKALGGGLHGSYEILAYLQMVLEFKRCGILPGVPSANVTVDGEKIPVAKAQEKNDISMVDASNGPVLLRIIRIETVRFDDIRTFLPIALEVRSAPGRKNAHRGETR